MTWAVGHTSRCYAGFVIGEDAGCKFAALVNLLKYNININDFHIRKRDSDQPRRFCHAQLDMMSSVPWQPLTFALDDTGEADQAHLAHAAYLVVAEVA